MARFLDREALEAEWGADRVTRLATEAAVDGGTVDEAIEAALEAADSAVLSRIGARYSVAELAPFGTPETTSPALKEHASAYAMQRLTKRHDIVSDDIKMAVARADAFFSGVAGGRYSIGLPDDPAVDNSEPLFLTSHTVVASKFDARGPDGGIEDW